MEKKMLNLLVVIGIVNAVILYIASLFFPAYVVIGNEFMESWIALIFTAFLLTVIIALTKPVMRIAKLKVKGDIAINISYGITNIVGLWVLARFAKFVGFGVSSFIIVVVLGVSLTLVQYVVWKMLVGKKAGK